MESKPHSTHLQSDADSQLQLPSDVKTRLNSLRWPPLPSVHQNRCHCVGRMAKHLSESIEEYQSWEEWICFHLDQWLFVRVRTPARTGQHIWYCVQSMTLPIENYKIVNVAYRWSYHHTWPQSKLRVIKKLMCYRTTLPKGWQRHSWPLYRPRLEMKILSSSMAKEFWE